MATYIQGLYDSPLSVTPFTPDYGFIQTVLKTKEAEYEQGFAQVKNLYNSLLNSKVSNDENMQVQKAYLADAERKLQSLASVDLSAPQNVAMARSVFKTYLNDNELMHDINVTRISDSQLAIGQSFLQSEDPKKRAMHSSLADEYVSTVPTNELKWAKRGDGSITKVRPRYYVPAVNLSEKFKDFMDASKYTGFTETRNGAGIIFKTSNGKTVEKGLYNLMNGLLTGDERKYFDMWGEVVYNRGLNEYVSSGISVDDARKELASDFYEKDLDGYKTQKGNAEKDLDRVNYKIGEYEKKTNLSQAEASELQQLYLTQKEYEQDIIQFGKDIDNLTTKKDEVYQRYYDGKWGILSDRILHTTMSSIAKGMGILTNKSEIKADESYYKNIENDINWYNAYTSRMKVGQGDDDGTGTGTGKGGGKMTEAEYKRMVANQPLDSGYEIVPQEEGNKLKKVWENRKSLHGIKMDAGNRLIEKLLGTEFNVGNAGIGVVTSALKEAQDGNKLSQPVKEFSDLWTWGHGVRKGVIPDSPRKRGFDRFLQLYGISPDGKGVTNSPFMNYLLSKGDGSKGATYADVADFLLKTANQTYEDRKSTMSDKERIELQINYYNQISKADELLEIFDKDQKNIESNFLDKLPEFLKSDKDKYDIDKYDIESLVITDDAGFRRLATKEELKAKLDDAYTVVKPGSPSMISASGNVNIQGTEPVYKLDDRVLRNKLARSYEDYDKIAKKLDETVANYLVANKFTLDEKTLKSFGTYILKADPQVQGEIAEQAIPKLLSDINLTVSMDDANPLDIRPIVDERYPSIKELDKLRELMGELKAATIAGDWAASIQYKQTTGDRGDNRKEYIVRFVPEKLNGLISHYAAKETYDKDKVNYLTKIKANGLEIRTNEPIPAGQSEYPVLERYDEANTFYQSPASMNDLYSYRIDKKGDGSGWYLSSDSYYNYKDPITGERKKMYFPADILDSIPPNASNQVVQKFINDIIYVRLTRAEDALQQNLSNPGRAKITAADIKKSLGF